MSSDSSSAVQARSCTNENAAGGPCRNSSEYSADLDALVRAYIISVLDAGVLTRQDMARYAGLSRGGVTQWLNGHRTMKLENASRLISLFGLDRFVHWLVRESQDKARANRRPDLLTLLEQVNVVLADLVEETLGARLNEDRKAEEAAEEEVAI